MKTYKLKSKSNKRTLWGDFDSDFYFNDLKNHIDKEEISEDIQLDFEGINSVDYSFIFEVFIKNIKRIENNNKSTFIFHNIETDAIVYYLNQSFAKNNLVAYVKDKTDLKSIGNESCLL